MGVKMHPIVLKYSLMLNEGYTSCLNLLNDIIVVDHAFIGSADSHRLPKILAMVKMALNKLGAISNVKFKISVRAAFAQSRTSSMLHLFQLHIY